MRYLGELKFFNEAKEYGFIVKDDDQKDIFFHFDDLRKEHMLTKPFLRHAKDVYRIRFAFNILNYFGVNGESQKAVDIELIELTNLTNTS